MVSWIAILLSLVMSISPVAGTYTQITLRDPVFSYQIGTESMNMDLSGVSLFIGGGRTEDGKQMALSAMGTVQGETVFNAMAGLKDDKGALVVEGLSKILTMDVGDLPIEELSTGSISIADLHQSILEELRGFPCDKSAPIEEETELFGTAMKATREDFTFTQKHFAKLYESIRKQMNAASLSMVDEMLDDLTDDMDEFTMHGTMWTADDNVAIVIEKNESNPFDARIILPAGGENSIAISLTDPKGEGSLNLSAAWHQASEDAASATVKLDMDLDEEDVPKISLVSNYQLSGGAETCEINVDFSQNGESGFANIAYNGTIDESMRKGTILVDGEMGEMKGSYSMGIEIEKSAVEKHLLGDVSALGNVVNVDEMSETELESLQTEFSGIGTGIVLKLMQIPDIQKLITANTTGSNAQLNEDAVSEGALASGK